MLYLDAALELVCVARDGVMHFFDARSGALAEEFPSIGAWDDELDGLLDDAEDLTNGRAEDPPAAIAPELLELARSVANDGRYYAYKTEAVVLEELSGGLGASDRALVAQAAKSIFFREIISDLRSQSQQYTAQLLADPEFDPLTFQRGHGLGEDLVSRRIPDASERLRMEVRMDLQKLASDRGLYEVARQKLVIDANAILDSMGQFERDRFGFATQKHLRAEILAPYLAQYSTLRHEDLLAEAVRCERERFASRREARYATAARELLRRGSSKKNAAKVLGLGASAFDRVEAGHPKDIALGADDHLLALIQSVQGASPK